MVVAVFIFLFLNLFQVYCEIPTTLEGPFDPVTVSLDENFRGNAIDLPDSDPRVRRDVTGFEPEQISVSLSSTHDSVWISWITGEFQIGVDIKPLDPKSVASVVYYGKLRFPMLHKATGESLIYNQLYPFNGLQNYTSGIIHHVRLTGLDPYSLYYYKVGDPSIPAMSHIHHFKTMPVSSVQSYPARVAVVGDLGLTYNSTSTIEHMTSNKPDLVLMVGDLCYANLYLTNGTGSDCYSCSFPNTPIHETYQPRWDYWGRFMQPLTSKIPIMMVQGNHEIEEQVDNRTFTSFISRFAFPHEESGSSSPFYYSFNAGGIHFVVLGGYVAYSRSDDQYKWLQKDLANVDRDVTPWLVAAWHPPWYTTYSAHYREAECMRVAMEDLLYQYGVDVVFNGHVHAYERSNRVYNYTLDPCGPVHLSVGDGGNREKMATTHADEPGNCPEPSSTPDEFMGGFCAHNFTSGPAAGKFCWDRQPEYSAYREASFGHGILEVKNETHALWSWHRNQDMYNEVGDQIYIVRQPEKCPVQPKMIKKQSNKVIGNKTVCCSKFLEPLGRGESGITGPVPGVSPPPPPYRGVVPDGGSGGVIALGVVVPAVVPPDETIPPAELQNGEKRAI
ncbi:purple acid phosphatase 15 [Perilla frutescens var. hirtella]|uniref:Purple acid phosphatase n=1 Tax=Perilla frutescens var. hirtella TaxID=608512 RepID=A0AAD4JJ15_PERFH|nr:purple acid phosphatase 15 [Perilla frutescens var. hirtella]